MLGVAHLGAAVGAPVEEEVNIALLVTGHDHRLGSELLAHVVAGLGDLTRVAHVHPGGAPDALEFGGIHGRVRVEGAVDAIGFDQPVERRGRRQSCHGASLETSGHSVCTECPKDRCGESRTGLGGPYGYL
jgi:hypothetical protein